MPKYSSDKKKIKPFSGLGSDRYRYLGLEEAEPNLGFTTEKQLPIKDQYYQLVTFDGGTLADRYWQQVAPVGVITGISIYNDGILVSIGNSINKLDFRGNIIDASASGTISTITVSSPGNENEIIYSGSNGDFDTSSKLIFNSNVGILTVSDGLNVGIGGSYLTVTPLGLIGINTNNPTQELHISGDIRLTGTIYDQNNNPGNTTDVLIKNSLGGLNWISQGSIRSGAGGTYTNIQYHNSAGLVDGASNFVYNPSNNRVGIGSTIPQQLLDVLGYSKFTGQTDISTLNISGVGTVSKLDVNNLTTLKDLKVVGFSTFDQYIDANNGAYIDNIRIGIANDNEIDTSTGNLTLDSAGGTTNIDDNLIISGSATINSTTQSTTKDTGALIVEGGVGIEKNANIGETLSVTGTSNLQGILTVGNDILPTVTNAQYLGSSSLKWDRLYANVLEGNITGNAASATKLFTSRNFSVSGDTSAPAVSFDGTANVDLVTTLANSGVVAGTYGSTTQVGILTVDAKGRITSASNQAINFSTATVAQADTIKTVSSSASLLYPTFVDSNNSPAAYEALYTDADISYNASTNLLTVSNIKPSGIQDSSGATGTDNYVLTANGSGGWTWKIASTSGGSAAIGGITVQEEGTLVGTATTLDFRGSGISTVTVSAGIATINVGGVESKIISGDTTLSINDSNKIIISTADSCVVTLPSIQDGLLFNFITTGYNIGLKTDSTYIHGRKSLSRVSIGSSDSGTVLYSYNNKWHVLSGTAPLHVESRSFASGTTYTPTPGTLAFLACVTGGGGGSDGGSNTNKGGGGGGGYAEKLYLPPLQSSYSMTIAAATPLVAITAPDGGTTTFGDVSVGIITATGGTKGTSSGGGTGGVGQGGDFNANGGNGGAGTNSGGAGGGAPGSRFGNGGNGGNGEVTVGGGGGNFGGNSGIGSTGGSDPTSLAVGIYNLGGGIGPANGGSFTLPTISLNGAPINSRDGRGSLYSENEGNSIPSNLSIDLGSGGGGGQGGATYGSAGGFGSVLGSITIVEIFVL